MLDWGAPHLLWILPAVWLAALVLHLYFRRRRMVVRFSDLEFFLRDEHHPAMRRRLRDLLKLLVRFLILTLPVLAVAAPPRRGLAPPGGGAGGRGRRAVVWGPRRGGGGAPPTPPPPPPRRAPAPPPPPQLYHYIRLIGKGLDPSGENLCKHYSLSTNRSNNSCLFQQGIIELDTIRICQILFDILNPLEYISAVIRGFFCAERKIFLCLRKVYTNVSFPIIIYQ